MIFSSDKCPLCGLKLKVKTMTLAPDKYVFFYYCDKMEEIRNDTNTADMAVYHYTNEWNSGYNIAKMIIPPFSLNHSEENNLTGVYGCSVKGRQPKKLIFRMPLLDIDYSKPHIVVAKLKVLVTFS